MVKLIGLCAYFIFSIVYVAGGVNGDAVGDRYWHDPGAFNGNGFRGVASVFVFCSTFYAGVEAVAVAATETKNPRVAVPLAIRQVFWRIIFSEPLERFLDKHWLTGVKYIWAPPSSSVSPAQQTPMG